MRSVQICFNDESGASQIGLFTKPIDVGGLDGLLNAWRDEQMSREKFCYSKAPSKTN